MPPTITMEELLLLVREGIKPEQPAKGPSFTTRDGVVHRGYPKASQMGGFEGKAGSVVRSRSGATRRLLNGRRTFINTLDSNDVISYTPRRIV